MAQSIYTYKNRIGNFNGRVPLANIISISKPIKYVLVYTNTSTAGDKSLIKYDLDFNEIASKTYAELGGNVNVRGRRIISEIEDDLYYWNTGAANATTYRIIRITASDLSTDQSANISSSGAQRAILPDLTINSLIIGEGPALRLRSIIPTAFTLIGTVIWSGALKVVQRISDYGASTVFAFFSSDTGSRVYSTNGSGWNANVWANNAYQARTCLYIKESDEIVLIDDIQSRVILSDGTSVVSGITNILTSLQFCSRFSNGDLLYYDNAAAELRRITYANFKANNNVPVANISLGNIVWFDIDSDDNVYVCLSDASNNLKKYDENLVQLLSITSLNGVANFGGGLAHK